MILIACPTCMHMHIFVSTWLFVCRSICLKKKRIKDVAKSNLKALNCRSYQQGTVDGKSFRLVKKWFTIVVIQLKHGELNIPAWNEHFEYRIRSRSQTLPAWNEHFEYRIRSRSLKTFVTSTIGCVCLHAHPLVLFAGLRWWPFSVNKCQCKK